LKLKGVEGGDRKRGTLGGERRPQKSLWIGVHHANAVVWGPVYRTHLRAVVHCLSTRTCNVRNPRSNSHASKGEHTAPLIVRCRFISSHTLLSRAATTAPATTSLCPLRYFVALCNVKSAPYSIGRHCGGVM